MIPFTKEELNLWKSSKVCYVRGKGRNGKNEKLRR